jgi:hypothetical protein
MLHPFCFFYSHSTPTLAQRRAEAQKKRARQLKLNGADFNRSWDDDDVDNNVRDRQTRKHRKKERQKDRKKETIRINYITNIYSVNV